MILDFGEAKQERWSRAAGMALCLLVLVFAVAAKLSWYQPKGVAMRSLTSSKMWQHEAKAAAAMTSAPADSDPIAAVSALLLLTAVTRWMMLDQPAAGEWLEREAAVAVQRAWFVRVSQLRAPPVR